MRERLKKFFGRSSHIIWIGACLAASSWLIESAVHRYFFNAGPFWTHVISPDGHETWMRLIVAAQLMVFSLYAQKLINHRLRIESALVAREKEAQDILEHNPAAIVLVDCDTRTIAYANHNALNMVNVPADKMVGELCNTYLCRTAKGKCPILDLNKQWDISEREIMTAAGRTIPILKNVTTVTYKGKPHLLEAFFDITPQRQMQRSLKQANIELVKIFQTASVGMRLIDRNFTILKVNREFSRLSGVAPEDAVGKKCFDVFSGEFCHTANCSLRRVMDGRALKSYEVNKTGADGSTFVCSLNISRFVGIDGMVGVVESFKDITELKRIQNQLQSERDLLHRILFHQYENLGIINDRYELEYQNEMLAAFTRGKESRRCYEVFRYRPDPCDDCFMQRAFQSESIQRCEFDTTSGSSYQHTYTPFVDNNGKKKVLLSRRDITETKASIASAIGSERLAALGELAAGVAHEINNPINSIINYAQILANKTNTGDQLNTISNRIIGEGDRIAAIVASLLSFARQENGDRKLVDVSDLLQEILTLIGAQLRKDGIKYVININGDLPPVYAATQEIERVFLNIINNSRYALNEKFSGAADMKKLDIDIGVVPANGRNFLRIVFTDYGVGITADLLSKVINPFVSTKPKGQGTGLGLSISQRIVENHGGRFVIDSVDGEYTRVTVDLPSRQR
ncbi:PAS domain S-box protein [Desulfoprunum benzoelyticum]|uniref:histidine kinase n=1 Tax=Desulfoprunum benzoelyticum TaxID=1506996 RepID=A0A840UR29_9BACT|nr:PAS domain S-box protein [Desulfoprunum benzoelyticum]MBB5347286.1 PAS domain S-box-containing protein [Desulfoprunum benzoelyticum]MBM9531782.1 PAS domain S-box protein [Desulfoprunum benzoelyticum]